MPGSLPYRGDGADRPALALPPDRMPRWHARRPRKTWRYVGVYGPDLSLCAGRVSVGGLPQGFWAVWDRGARVLRERTRRRAGIADLSEGIARFAGDGIVADLVVETAGEPVEVVSPHGRSYIWTRKTPVRARGSVSVDGRALLVDAPGLIDESSGYHARETRWSWSAGAGLAVDGAHVVWNLVDGVHDAPVNSERTVWVDGVPRELGPAVFAADLSSLRCDGAQLHFAAESERASHDRLRPLVESIYRQPFGTFSGALPGVELADAYGVMEHHDVKW